MNRPTPPRITDLLAELAPAGDPPADLPVAQVQALLQHLAQPVRGTESLPLSSALGRVLAGDITSAVDVPPHDNSAMDGYAFCGSLLANGAPLSLPVAGTVLAGQPWQGSVPAGAALRIMTGALLPTGLDTVVPFERCTLQEDPAVVHFAAAGLQPGANHRRRGEELAAGATALAAGTRLGPAELGLIASLGRAQVDVHRRLRVALFSTGDEILQPGDAPRTGAIYDSNRFALAAALQQLGCEVQDLGAVRDEPAALRTTLLQAAQQADVILTSGGVSSGDADHTKAMMRALGDVAFLRIAMRPGRPMAVGRMQADAATDAPGALLLGLPGNPVAAMVSFLMLARPALLQCMGMPAAQPLTVPAQLAVPLRKRTGRTEWVCATLTRDGQGQLWAQPTGNQGSAMLSSLVQADALLVLPPALGNLEAGTRVDVVLLHGLL